VAEFQQRKARVQSDFGRGRNVFLPDVESNAHIATSEFLLSTSLTSHHPTGLTTQIPLRLDTMTIMASEGGQIQKKSTIGLYDLPSLVLDQIHSYVLSDVPEVVKFSKTNAGDTEWRIAFCKIPTRTWHGYCGAYSFEQCLAGDDAIGCYELDTALFMVSTVAQHEALSYLFRHHIIDFSRMGLAYRFSRDFAMLAPAIRRIELGDYVLYDTKLCLGFDFLRDIVQAFTGIQHMKLHVGVEPSGPEGCAFDTQFALNAVRPMSRLPISKPDGLSLFVEWRPGRDTPKGMSGDPIVAELQSAITKIILRDHHLPEEPQVGLCQEHVKALKSRKAAIAEQKRVSTPFSIVLI
jgi:hypothetical protein